jgi:hypothetical protein
MIDILNKRSKRIEGFEIRDLVGSHHSLFIIIIECIIMMWVLPLMVVV